MSRRPTAVSLQVPRLRTSPAAHGEPTAWFITPSLDRPSGGIRKLYRAVDVLNTAGLSAAVVHDEPGQACTWFDHTTRVAGAAEVRIGPHDVLVVPEVYWSSTADLPSGVRQVVYNQNAYNTLDSVVAAGSAAGDMYRNPDVVGVLAVSEENAEVLRYAFAQVPVHRIRHGMDPELHFPPASPARRRLAYLPRRRSDEAAQVLGLLEARGALAGWEVVALDGLSERALADELRDSRVFLSLSEREGFGLPPAEALACGCLVVGFDGFAGREFFGPPFARSVENGDVVALARELEDVLAWVDTEPDASWDAARAGSASILETYTTEVERRDLVEVFGPLLSGDPADRSVSGTAWRR